MLKRKAVNSLLHGWKNKQRKRKLNKADHPQQPSEISACSVLVDQRQISVGVLPLNALCIPIVLTKRVTKNNAFLIGETVSTDFSGKITYHTVIGRYLYQSQSGFGYRVDPPVPKSTGGTIDHAWFKRVQNDHNLHCNS